MYHNTHEDLFFKDQGFGSDDFLIVSSIFLKFVANVTIFWGAPALSNPTLGAPASSNPTLPLLHLGLQAINFSYNQGHSRRTLLSDMLSS